jgi:hypothetical protein
MFTTNVNAGIFLIPKAACECQRKCLPAVTANKFTICMHLDNEIVCHSSEIRSD